MSTIRLRVKALTRDDAAAIALRLKATAGVLFATAGAESGYVEVEVDDDRVGVRDVQAAVRAFGYDSNLAG